MLGDIGLGCDAFHKILIQSNNNVNLEGIDISTKIIKMNEIGLNNMSFDTYQQSLLGESLSKRAAIYLSLLYYY